MLPTAPDQGLWVEWRLIFQIINPLLILALHFISNKIRVVLHVFFSSNIREYHKVASEISSSTVCHCCAGALPHLHPLLFLLVSFKTQTQPAVMSNHPPTPQSQTPDKNIHWDSFTERKPTSDTDTVHYLSDWFHFHTSFVNIYVLWSLN